VRPTRERRVPQRCSIEQVAHPKNRKSRVKWKWLIAIAALAVCVAAVGDYWLYPRFASMDGRSFNRGTNGLWLRYTWYFGDYRPSDLRNLDERLQKEQIRDAYFHVRYADSKGNLHYRFEQQARFLNSHVHSTDKRVRAFAWIYVGNQHGKGGVDLSDSEVRSNLVKSAQWLINACGFDGIQWDYEICPDGDQDFLKLLEETRAALGNHVPMSVAAPQYLPKPLTRFSWSQGYLSEVAKRCDQIDLMTYDTGMYFPRAYVWLVSKQVNDAATTIKRAHPACQVLIGLPTYEDATPSHNPRAENLLLGLKGVREAQPQNKLAVDGIALFADYTTDNREWGQYERYWLAN